MAEGGLRGLDFFKELTLINCLKKGIFTAYVNVTDEYKI